MVGFSSLSSDLLCFSPVELNKRQNCDLLKAKHKITKRLLIRFLLIKTHLTQGRVGVTP